VIIPSNLPVASETGKDTLCPMLQAEREPVLGIFAKQPLPGAVKTRLAKDTSPEFAARVAEAFLLDTLGRLRRIEARRVVAFAPPESESYFREVTQGYFDLTPQAPGDLGDRMEDFFRQHLAQAVRVVLVGTDSPTLPIDYVVKAFESLRTADLVLGPANDGGYYLIGCRGNVHERIFRGVNWGGNQVLGQTVARVPQGYKLDLLPVWYDVDTLLDLDILKGHVSALRRADVVTELPCVDSLIGPFLPFEEDTDKRG
jgi:rSAM/selenodomain-associated transferase 1